MKGTSNDTLSQRRVRHAPPRQWYDLSMRTTRYLLICLVLTIIGLVSLGEGVQHGDASLNVGTSLASNSLRFCGTSSGGWTVIGMLATLGGIVFFVMALIASMRRSAA